jgi:hypothetical protein
MDGGWWSTPTTGCFTPVKENASWAPGQVWTCTEILASTEIWLPDRPARSESLFRPSWVRLKKPYADLWCLRIRQEQEWEQMKFWFLCLLTVMNSKWIYPTFPKHNVLGISKAIRNSTVLTSHTMDECVYVFLTRRPNSFLRMLISLWVGVFCPRGGGGGDGIGLVLASTYLCTRTREKQQSRKRTTKQQAFLCVKQLKWFYNFDSIHVPLRYIQ